MFFTLFNSSSRFKLNSWDSLVALSIVVFDNEEESKSRHFPIKLCASSNIIIQLSILLFILLNNVSLIDGLKTWK